MSAAVSTSSRDSLLAHMVAFVVPGRFGIWWERVEMSENAMLLGWGKSSHLRIYLKSPVAVKVSQTQSGSKLGVIGSPAR